MLRVLPFWSIKDQLLDTSWLTRPFHGYDTSPSAQSIPRNVNEFSLFSSTNEKQTNDLLSDKLTDKQKDRYLPWHQAACRWVWEARV